MKRLLIGAVLTLAVLAPTVASGSQVAGRHWFHPNPHYGFTPAPHYGMVPGPHYG